jgi:hypothetical protein
MLPCHDAWPLQESNVIGKGGTAGFLGPAYDPYYFTKIRTKILSDDLSLRKGSRRNGARRETLLKKIDNACPKWRAVRAMP